MKIVSRDEFMRMEEGVIFLPHVGMWQYREQIVGRMDSPMIKGKTINNGEQRVFSYPDTESFYKESVATLYVCEVTFLNDPTASGCVDYSTYKYTFHSGNVIGPSKTIDEFLVFDDAKEAREAFGQMVYTANVLGLPSEFND